MAELLRTGPATEQQLHIVLDLLRFAFDIYDVFDSEQLTEFTNLLRHLLQKTPQDQCKLLTSHTLFKANPSVAMVLLESISEMLQMTQQSDDRK